MAFAFDTLGYAQHLRSAGVPDRQAEGHAEAAREFIMAELVTRTDLEIAIASVRRDMENLEMRMTIRLGGIIAIAVAILAAVVKL